jgi:hypothetical protein
LKQFCVTSQQERRALQRQQAHEMGFEVHVRECLEDPGLNDELIEARLADFSDYGVRLVSDTMLVADTVLDIRITAANPATVYKLIGRIQWTKLIGDHCHMGIRLEHADDTDLYSWVVDYGI